MYRYLRLINVFIAVLMVAFVFWGIWNNYEETKLNKQHEELLAQFDRHVEERGEINQRYKQLVDQMEKENETINLEVGHLRLRLQELLDHLEDRFP